MAVGPLHVHREAPSGVPQLLARYRTKGWRWKGPRPRLRRQGKRAMALTEAEVVKRRWGMGSPNSWLQQEAEAPQGAYHER